MRQAIRRPGVRLVLTSGTLLFVELVVLRWIPANVTYIGFFSNFLLMRVFSDRIGSPGSAFRNLAGPFPLCALMVGPSWRQLDVSSARPRGLVGLSEASERRAFRYAPWVALVARSWGRSRFRWLATRSLPPFAYALDVGSIVGLRCHRSLGADRSAVWFASRLLLTAALLVASHAFRGQRRVRPGEVRLVLARRGRRSLSPYYAYRERPAVLTRPFGTESLSAMLP